MFYERSPKEIIEYDLKTEPPEAMYWDTYRLKKVHIKLIDGFEKQDASDIKTEILDDIKRVSETRLNTDSLATSPSNKIPKKQKATVAKHVKTRKTQ
jgi:hypothetical protein